MATEQQRPFAAGFMDDYYAEADEHIMVARRSLLALEQAGSDLPASTLEDLFRSFHSLKGISAMVELRDVELLAHHMEGCLRAVREGDLPPTDAVEPLVDGAKLIDEIVAAHRLGRPVPDSAAFIERLGNVSRGRPPGSARGSLPSTSAGPSASLPTWRVIFVPTPELVERGVKVDTVRQRLLTIGRILSVSPKVVPGGGVSFEFLVATTHEERLIGWQNDGLTYERVQVDAAPSSVESGEALPPHLAPTVPQDGGAGRAQFVRVDLTRLDDLMRLVGDMVVTRARLDDTLNRIERHVPYQEWRALQEHNAGIERQLRDLREGVMRVRLVPIGEIFRRMPFVVRDLARDSGKRVRLDLAGQATEIDKLLIERMMDPVLHLVRNAISHGIELPDARTAVGKAPAGTIRLSASTAGQSVVLEIADDGRGIDVEAVAERARAAGNAVPEAPLDPQALLDIICASGFSTREEADRASGRGVGMAVVRSTVQELGGTLDVATQPGQGTTFTVTLPLTLAITDAIIAHVGDQTFAVPQSAVREVIEVDASALRSLEHNELVPYRGATLPIVRLSRLFTISVPAHSRFHAIVVGAGLSAVGLLVDRIGGQQEIVVKAVTDSLIRVDGVSGATELGDGRLVLILDVGVLARMRQGPEARGAYA